MWNCAPLFVAEARLLPAKDVLSGEPDCGRPIEHADLDAMIDRAGLEHPIDELMMRRLKKRRLALRDEIARLELVLDPKEPA